MRHRGLTVLVALTLLCAHFSWVAPHTSAAAEKANEIEVKAAFLFHITRYVSWPSEAFFSLDSNIVIGIVDDEQFARVAQRVIRGKSVNNRQIEVRSFENVRAEPTVHVLFVGAKQKRNSKVILENLGSSPVFCIADWKGFATAGGVANFYLDNEKLRFAINREAAKVAGLLISSHLLRLAKVVDMKG